MPNTTRQSVSLKLPPDIVRELKAEAKENSRSLNSHIHHILKTRVRRHANRAIAIP